MYIYIYNHAPSSTLAFHVETYLVERARHLRNVNIAVVAVVMVTKALSDDCERETAHPSVLFMLALDCWH